MDHWWVPGLQIGFEHSFIHGVADFYTGIASGTPVHPTFRDALETQLVCDAILKSADTNSWQSVNA
jgi:predicted dehydrogenase